MSDLWHHGRQTKAEQPVTFSELRRLVRKGRLEGGDLVRKQGDPQWVAASKVPGLHARRRPRWYYTHWNKSLGPVTGTQLRQLAAAGMIEPTDLVWREGFDRWKRARKLAGLFPDPGADTTRNSTAKPQRPDPPMWNHHTMAAVVGLMVVLAVIAALTFHPRERSVVPASEAASVLTDSSSEQVTVPGPSPVSPIATPALPPSSAVMVDAKPGPSPSDAPPPPSPESKTEEHVAVRRPILPASPLLDRIKAAAEPLIAAQGEKDHGYRFEVFDSDEIDVFSLPDGTIYVSRAVFQLVSDDVELTWLIGHEMAHAELRHGPTAPEAGHAPSPDQEHAADEWVTQRLLGLGHTRRECLSFLRRYRSYLQTTPAAKPSLVTGPEAVALHWHDHPAPSARISRLESIQLPLESRATASSAENRPYPHGASTPSGEDSSRIE